MRELLSQSWFWTCLLLIQRVAPPKVLSTSHARGDVPKAALDGFGAAFFSPELLAPADLPLAPRKQSRLGSPFSRCFHRIPRGIREVDEIVELSRSAQPQTSVNHHAFAIYVLRHIAHQIGG